MILDHVLAPRRHFPVLLAAVVDKEDVQKQSGQAATNACMDAAPETYGISGGLAVLGVCSSVGSYLGGKAYDFVSGAVVGVGKAFSSLIGHDGGPPSCTNAPPCFVAPPEQTAPLVPPSVAAAVNDYVGGGQLDADIQAQGGDLDQPMSIPAGTLRGAIQSWLYVTMSAVVFGDSPSPEDAKAYVEHVAGSGVADKAANDAWAFVSTIEQSGTEASSVLDAVQTGWPAGSMRRALQSAIILNHGSANIGTAVPVVKLGATGTREWVTQGMPAKTSAPKAAAASSGGGDGLVTLVLAALLGAGAWAGWRTYKRQPILPWKKR